MSLNINHVAFATVTGLSIASLAVGTAAFMVASTVASVALGILAGLGACASLAASWAYFSPTSTNVENYFKNVKETAGYVIAGMSQFVLQTLVQAVITGIAQGIGKRIERKIAGPDITFARA